MKNKNLLNLSILKKKLLHTSQKARQAGAYPGFHGMSEELRRVLASSSYFCNCSPYFVSMASSLLIYNASKKELKCLGTREDLLDLLSSKLGIDSSDFQVQDKGTYLVLKPGNITCNFYTKEKTLQL